MNILSQALSGRERINLYRVSTWENGTNSLGFPSLGLNEATIVSLVWYRRPAISACSLIPGLAQTFKKEKTGSSQEVSLT